MWEYAQGQKLNIDITLWVAHHKIHVKLLNIIATLWMIAIPLMIVPLPTFYVATGSQ